MHDAKSLDHGYISTQYVEIKLGFSMQFQTDFLQAQLNGMNLIAQLFDFSYSTETKFHKFVQFTHQ